MMRADLHTHTVFCDGQNTPEEMVLAALEKGMDCIGFSGHSYLFLDLPWCMTPEGTKRYREEILRLREKYKGQIRILLGIEEDYYSEDDPADYDYMIGSVHMLKRKDRWFSVDESRETQLKAIDDLYSGDAYAFSEHYFEVVSDVVRKTGCDIIGHFDLLTKFNENAPYIDTEHPRYRAAWKKAADMLIESGKPFEVNTGAISRGYTTEPYPSAEIREYIASRGGKLFLTGDTHAKENLMYRFGQYRTYENTSVEEVIRDFLACRK